MTNIKNKDAINEKITMEILSTISNVVNYNIVGMLPSNVKNIMVETGLTKVPVNNRLNQLERCFIVKRYRGTGLVFLTDFGKTIIQNTRGISMYIDTHHDLFVNSFINSNIK